VADNGNKKAWMELLVELKKAANQQGFSLVANGGHKGTTHCLRCHRGILAAVVRKNQNFGMEVEQIYSSDVLSESLVNSKRSNTRVNGRSMPRKSSSNRPVTKETLCPVKIVIYKDHEQNVFYVKNTGGARTAFREQVIHKIKPICTLLLFGGSELRK